MRLKLRILFNTAKRRREASTFLYDSVTSLPHSLHTSLPPPLFFHPSLPSLPQQLILAATEQFNRKPKQGINFLVEQGILASPVQAAEVADFLLENPGLRKEKIGDYIGDRKNAEILEAFVR